MLGGGAIKGTVLALRPLTGTPAGWWALVDMLGTIGIAIGVLAITVRVLSRARRLLLWRVRRKLTLSYIFIGVVPAILIVGFFLLAGLLLAFNLSAYLTQSRVDALVAEGRLLAAAAVEDLATSSDRDTLVDTLTRRQRRAARPTGLVSYAVVPASVACGGEAVPVAGTAVVTAGPWPHVAPPNRMPEWVPCDGYGGLGAYTVTGSGADGESPSTGLFVRAVAVTEDTMPVRAVIVDRLIGARAAREFLDDTGIAFGEVTPLEVPGSTVMPTPGRVVDEVRIALPTPGTLAARLEQPLAFVAFLDFTDWASGDTGRVAMSISMNLTEVYARISNMQGPPGAPGAPGGGGGGGQDFGQILVRLLMAVGGAFVLIQLVALAMGLVLARSITGSVHELFLGTQRVREGNFAHKIAIRTRDQMGELAESFNSMTGSIEDLLRQKAVKERMEEELRIARDIQMSLLPRGPLTVPGFDVAVHCEPAREVGGDYYDLLPLSDHAVGVLVADVSGKGTSAALYMAELKGVMLSLSTQFQSPRDLLVAADHILGDHLDNRSFITATYAVIDAQARVFTYGRAGHCPLIYRPGAGEGRQPAQVLTPDGMVMGLTIGDRSMFARVLEEVSLPIAPGDLFVLYTDGVSEAMNADDDCFGDERIAGIVESAGALDADAVMQRMLEAVRGFVGTAPQHDDMTMLIVKAT